MTSQINPNNINGAYPVAGQDNNSQGFRDNFTYTSQNFSYAASEITDLQNKAVLTAPLGNSGGSVTNQMNFGNIVNVQLRGQTYTTASLGSFSTPGANVNFNYNVGSYQTASISANVNLGFTNFPTAGLYSTIRTQLTTTASNVVLTMPAAVGNGAAATSLSYIIGRTANTQQVNMANTGTYVFEFSTADGGSTVFIQDLTRGASSTPTP
jgi:hypothetical protein